MRYIGNIWGPSLVKTHTGLMNRTNQMRARLEARLELLVNRISRIMSHLGHPRKPSNPAYRVTYLYVLPYLSLYVLSYLRKHDYKYGSYRIDYSIGMKECKEEGNQLPRRKASFLIANLY
jgi:hypothetical protein